MEVQSQVSPLTFNSLGHVLDGRDMERYEGVVVDWYQDCVVFLINIELTRFKVSWNLSLIVIRLNISHLLYLLLLSGGKDFSILVPLLELF
jgi:hypothetical protein